MGGSPQTAAHAAAVAIAAGNFILALFYPFAKAKELLESMLQYRIRSRPERDELPR
jgi:hypothetical protein